MSHPFRLTPVWFIAIATAAAILAACSGQESTVQPIAGRVPDFSLTDVNPNSATSGLVVSPRQYLQKVSAWYFGHAT